MLYPTDQIDDQCHMQKPIHRFSFAKIRKILWGEERFPSNGSQLPVDFVS